MARIIRSIFLVICLIFMSNEVIAEVVIKGSGLLISRWRLDGPNYYDGNSYSAFPFTFSVGWGSKLYKSWEVALEYEFIPVSILSPDFRRDYYNGFYYWIRQRLEFNDSRLRICLGKELINQTGFGNLRIRLWYGACLNTLLSGKYEILVTPEATTYSPGASVVSFPIEKESKWYYEQGYAWNIASELLWRKPIKSKLDLQVGIKYEYAHYNDKQVSITSFADKKKFKLVSNTMLTISAGLVFRFRKS